VTEPQGERSVWIKTDLTPTGYVVTLDASDDNTRILTPDEALAYAAGVLAAAARAEYDAAVLKQITGKKLSLPMAAAAEVIETMRKDRPPLDPRPTRPFTFHPGVTGAGKAFLHVDCEGEEPGQWTPKQAREHAMWVLESVAVADLDSGYLQTLVATVGSSRDTATQVVDDLANYREKP
jgi:hypothetical protein